MRGVCEGVEVLKVRVMVANDRRYDLDFKLPDDHALIFNGLRHR